MASIGEGDLRPWKIHGERCVYDSPWVRVGLVDVEPPGVPRFDHHVVRLKHVAITAVVDSHDRILMLRRYRFVSQRFAWELPGGMVDEGEEPHEAAVREVLEETGWRPCEVRHLMTFEPMAGSVNCPHALFLAREATYVGEPTDAEEAGQVSWVPLADIPGMVVRDELTGAGTLVAVLRVLAFAER